VTGSPFSLVVGNEGTDSTFHNVLATQAGDTTTETASRPVDADGESSVGLLRDAAGDTHESGQDETAGQTDTSGTDTIGA
jgi:hypothetical protein